MDPLPIVDPAMLAQQSAQNDLVRRKLDMDSLRKRLGDTATKEEKLRESCEGFEAIFLQKMWEQMRKNVPKEGYLHSKDEEAYQSLFDVELCKKMASAGGIGLADMLYQQLSQQLENTGRTTRPGTYRNPLDIAPAGLMAAQKESGEAPGPSLLPQDTDKKLTAENLYSPLPEQKTEENSAEKKQDPISGALHDIRASLGMAPKDGPGAAAREWAEARAKATGLEFPVEQTPGLPGNENQPTPPAQLAEKSPVAGDSAAPALGGQGAVNNAPAVGAANATPSSGAAAPIPAAEAAKPASAEQLTEAEAKKLFGRRKKSAKSSKDAAAEKSAPVQPRGMAPQETLWPLGGAGGTVVSNFGWEDDKASGKRHWNSGVRIAAPPQSPVRAVLDGTVVYVGQREGFGHTVVLEHKDGFRSYYSSLEDSSVRVGDKIKHGAEFAKIAVQAPSPMQGENSASLHFELKKGEMALNPENAITRSGA